MQEQWKQIEEFPKYAVSDQGNVKHISYDRVVRVSRSQRGYYVSLMSDGLQYQRSLALLVATAFVDPYEYHNHGYFFGVDHNTVAHRNGDRSDCRAENLVWRSRAHAIDHHQQFGDPDSHYNRSSVEIRDSETGEVLPIQELSVRVGLSARHIFNLAYDDWQQYHYDHRGPYYRYRLAYKDY